jgi:hypothetical protein
MVLSFCRGPGSIHALKSTRIPSQISICARLAIAVLGVEWTLRRVNRDVIEALKLTPRRYRWLDLD